jgi:hypothetical protein
MKDLIFLLVTLSFLSFSACGNLEKEIDLDLPEYQNQYVVECYLEPGQPFSLLLTQSFAYFDPFPTDLADFVDNLLVDSAVVVISHNGTDYTLANQLFPNLITGKVYNYFNPELVPQDYDHDFSLKITLPNGKTITSTTRLLPVVPIDSVVVEFNEKEDTLARVLTYLTDDQSTENYYRRMLHENSLDSLPQQDFTTFDDFVDDGRILFGSSYDFVEGDTVYNTIFHIERAYFDYWESVVNAVNANGNPFAQPTAIISNVTGDANALGIFTGISYDRDTTIITK